MEVKRSQEVYEHIEHYPKPPLLPESSFDEKKSLGNMNTNAFHAFLFKSFLFLSRYKNFKKNISKNLENLLRKSDFTSGVLFAPVVSATLSIKDDLRKLSSTERATTLIFAAIEFYKDLSSGKLIPDKHRNQILEMGQYPNLFSTTQIIHNGKVSIYKSKNKSQITVIVEKRFFLLELKNVDKEYTFEQVKMSLEKIIDRASKKKKSDNYKSPGTITCAKNKTQINIFKELNKNENNNEILNKIKHSFLTLCFDLNYSPESDAEAARIAQIGNYENRWYHNSLQIVVFGNSKTSLVCNFSNSISGNVMMRVGSELQKRAAKIIIEKNTNKLISVLKIEELKWEIKDEFIIRSQKDIKPILDNQKSTFEIKLIGKKFFESKNVKEVPAFILALQMTVKKLTKKNLKITQFLTMSKYRCCDLTTTSVSTPEVLRFTDFIFQNSNKKERSIEYLKSAIASQQEKIKSARKTLPLIELIQLYLKSLRGIKKKYVIMLFIITNILLWLTGFIKKHTREVIVSHPKIYEEVTVVGRPGVKIPYANHFGLHYQIFNEKIVITMMPGVIWKISNFKFINELTANLEIIKTILK